MQYWADGRGLGCHDGRLDIRGAVAKGPGIVPTPPESGLSAGFPQEHDPEKLQTFASNHATATCRSIIPKRCRLFGSDHATVTLPRGRLVLIRAGLRVVGRALARRLIRQILPHVGHDQHSRPQLRRGNSCGQVSALRRQTQAHHGMSAGVS